MTDQPDDVKADPQPLAPPPKPRRVSGAAWLARKARKEDARGCYRYILGRDAEDEAVLEQHAESAGTIGTLRDRFLRSAEFRRSLLDAAAPEDGEAPVLDLEAEEEALAQMMLWQQRVWARLGEEAPHWSVLPEDRFRPAELPANRKPFLASGAADAALLLGALRRCGIAPEEVPHLLEHGCGVGRVTAHLAQHFPEITGVDVSPGHLTVARQYLRDRGLVHLRWLRAKDGQPMPGEGYHLWYSRAVLQWNPPPLMRQILWLAFGGLPPGGVAVFQLPVWAPGYRFDAAGYLAGRQPNEPVPHLLPQPEVFALAAAAGMRVLEVRDDDRLPSPLPAGWRSSLFVLRKAG